MNDAIELPKKHVFVVDKNNKSAMAVMMKLCRNKLQHGSVVTVTPEEFDALKDGVLILDIIGSGTE